jgi:hypothetical protein
MLDVNDIEMALTNIDHLRAILKRHNFKCTESVLYPANGIINPLFPDLVAKKSEIWMPRNDTNINGELIIPTITINEWVQDHEPRPKVIKTIEITINQHITFADGTNKFLESIKNRFPNKNVWSYNASQKNKQYSQKYDVFTNKNSKIQVTTSLLRTYNSSFYVFRFDLLK